MIYCYFRKIFFVAFLTATFQQLFAQDFVFVDQNIKTTIVYDAKGPALDSIAAHLLQQDIERVTGFLPKVVTDISKVKGNVVVIGNINSVLLRKMVSNENLLSKNLAGKWECYGLKFLNKPFKNINQALVIAGSDTRGTAYGVFSISEKIGVSPWYWWADVSSKQKKVLKISAVNEVSSPPSVKYRGIFLNDEDWGLQPWAAKTFEPETGDIGPKTYSKIFELLLRLKANLIWPAMHPSTKPFYHYPGNIKVAADYAMIIGSSHAEPMLRNNVGEWTKEMGAFNYISNKEKVYNYWEQRVKESSGNEVIYSLGMRGVHDSGMEGVKSVKEAIPLLQQIFEDQRRLLTKYSPTKITAIPQVFTVYKEVLEIYDSNLKLPDDVTLVWPDDNYGYIQRLNNSAEKQRSGSSGVYYHASYWGRPHDYLWLSSTHPGLIREEMMKAYQTKADRLWVMNVGDLKPLEYNIQFFLDMAYAAELFKSSAYTKKHLNKWVEKTFGQQNTEKISDILWKYDNLAFERRPEFMGWSQTEPTTKTNYTDYNHFYYGDEARRRLNSYEELEKAVTALRTQISPETADAFYQLVYYPVMCAAIINKKFLYRDKSFFYAQQNRLSAFAYADSSKAAYQAIVEETNYYNNELAHGKWKNLMSMEPRDLPVYQEPDFPAIHINSSEVWGIAPEGFVKKDSSLINHPAIFTLPAFSKITNKKHFVDVFLSDKRSINWTVSSRDNWIKFSKNSGTLNPKEKPETRIYVSIDWTQVPAGKELTTGSFEIKGAGKTIAVNVEAFNPVSFQNQNFKGFVEDNGYISIIAKNYSLKTVKSNADWQLIEGMGNAEQLVMATPIERAAFSTKNLAELKQSVPVLEYDFYSFTAGMPTINIWTLPTHPINNNYGMRYAACVDDGMLTILDFKTTGRSEEWKQSVLKNSISKSFTSQHINQGKHTLKICMIDPGVILQNITIDFGGLQKAYSIIPETKN
jgi:hypothetical protein